MTHVELRWLPLADGMAVARLFTGTDQDLKQMAGTIACPHPMMNAVDRLFSEGAKHVTGVTYAGREIKNDWEW